MKANAFTSLMIVISFIGLGLTVFLIFQHYVGSTVCDLSQFISCNTANRSIYSEFFGIPAAIFGSIYFIIVLVLFGMYEKKRFLLKYVFYISLLSLVPAFYLTYIEFFVIGSICIFCESTKVVIVVITVLSFMQLRKNKTVSHALES